MKLHFLIPGDIDTLASCYIYDKRLIEGLKKKGHAVEVHRLSDDFPFPSDESIIQFTKTIRQIPKGETVIIDSLALGVIPAVLKELSITNPIIGLMHLPLSVDPNYSAYQRTLITKPEMEALGYVGKFIVSSLYTQETLINLGIDENKINLVTPGIDDVPQKKNYPERPSKLLSIANMCRSKDHSLLVRALTALKDKDWELHCYGNLDWDRNYLADFQALIRKNNLQKKILVHGTISGKELSDAYLEADLFVHPSDFETYGMAMVEALAHGLPVVASTGGGIQKTIPSKMAQFFKPSDVYGLQSILEELFENPVIYKRLYTQALTYKQTAQTWSQTIELFEKALM
ncbi:MAG TPA: glycosyltransferase family 4 protein [Bacteroidales bacterium]|nr:glycosyltransferase family 4 protein [Bacteroidales bacterium]